MKEEKAVSWFDNMQEIGESPILLAKQYSDRGADELIVFDLSDTDEEHEEAIAIMKRMNRMIGIPIVAGGNIRRMEDVEKVLDTGAKRVILNFSKPESVKLIKEVKNQYGKEKIAVSLNDFDTLFKQQHLIDECSSSIIFMHRLDLNSVVSITEIPHVIVTDTMEESEILRILKSPGVKGVSGRFVSQPDLDFYGFKEQCTKENIKMTSFETSMEFSEFQVGSDGLLPVVVQNYKTGEVLTMAYMDKEAFDTTVKTGKMTYYSRKNRQIVIKGDEGGNPQYVKSMSVDCDKDTLLAKVEQNGCSCSTGSTSCFSQQIVGTDYDGENPLQIFEAVYESIAERRAHPREGSYTNYLFDKGLDNILKKIGEEATELVIAAKNPNQEEISHELSDFLYHAMMLMVERGISWEDIIKELADRRS